jgi:hydroxymethylpyrimidine/phosphomethylpyrimidine kinase
LIHKTLTIAGFDASGGAGIQADLKTFSALGCYGMSILTAIPIQNTRGVTNCYEIPLDAIEEQLISIFSDIRPDAIKIGMLFNSEIIDLVATFLSTHAHGIPIVVDPVMVAKSGDHLLKPDAISILKARLFPLATIVTPNIDETNAICGMNIQNEKDMQDAGQHILSLGTQAVIVKGGHLKADQCRDLLLTPTTTKWLTASRIVTKNTHGTGCTFSAALAANLAHKLDLPTSCMLAKEYITGAIDSFKDEIIGHGYGPVNHFYQIWQTKNV